MKNKYVLFFIFISILYQNTFATNKNNFSSEEELNEINKYKQLTLKPEYPNVKNIGRFFIRDDITYLAQSGSALEFYLFAKSAEIILAGDGSTIYHEDYEKVRYAIYVNEKLLIDTTMSEKEKKIKLFNNEIEQKIKIKIILLSEAIFGCIGIKNIIVISSLSENLAIKPTENKKYKIEFIGDSITCAYGIEAKAPNEYFDTRTQNFEKSYAFLSAKELDCDYSVICYSGCGLISTGNKIFERYTKINYFSYNKEWNFEKYKNDIIVINLGTNDAGYIWGFRIDEFVEKYNDFLKIVREKNPNAYIICIIGMMGSEELFPLINEAINLFGDRKVFSYLLPAQKIEDGIGAEFHPNWVSHAKWGKLISEIIKEVINSEIY